MRTTYGLLLLAAAVLAADDAPRFNEKGELHFPAGYREWVYLSSGLGMTYGPAAATTPANPLFDNVFVNRKAWDAFKKTGKWPDGATFILEVRQSTSHGSINKGGAFQTSIKAIEVEVKDSKRFPDGWAYFDFGAKRTAVPALGKNASCLGCHVPNGAVENTFVQFYPEALEIAQAKGTVKPAR